MATVTRFGTAVLRQKNGLFRPQLLRTATISTSKKNKDTATLSDTLVEKEEKAEPVVNSKNWVSWGYSIESQVEDNTNMHLAFFFSVTLCLVTGGYVLAYWPDLRLRDWAQREAYVELRRREAEGLPLIDCNLVSLDKIELPDDEELGDTTIII
ncbi:NADH dehydrogenase 1 beta subcomplex subunit 11 ndufb11 [Halocaridina rubra]|uniref:NADH dehydrogenase [ubiquinone] 1 beta subcomplex subunit 11, mitochondrial n=1 Tax=Halocaridina rubra TaxID=373956 RepID=A0AAN9A7F2_HALRR